MVEVDIDDLDKYFWKGAKVFALYLIGQLLTIPVTLLLALLVFYFQPEGAAFSFFMVLSAFIVAGAQLILTGVAADKLWDIR